jgi:protein tyrosine phosphatase type 4A
MKESGGGPIMIGSKPTLITVDGTPLRFLIMDAPRPNNLHLYIKECKKYNVTDVVRVCEPTYSKTDLIHAGIQLHEMPYPDGHSPPEEVLDRWLDLVHERFFANPIASGSYPTIAVHCVAGLGRAPVLVAIALIEFQKMDPVEAVVLIRKHRRGAINDKQLNFLETYQRRYKKGGGGSNCCIVM